MASDIIAPEKVNIVTEHKENYKLVSLFLMDSYNGLHPSSISRLAHIIFNLIIYNKIYRNPDNKHYSLEEDKRIYSNILITPESILKRIMPHKYQLESKNMSNDISNLTSRIQTLDENNIFYVWRYRQPFTYLFILERDVGCWKYYNSTAFVTPRTMKKIVRSGKCIMDTMVKLESKRGREVDARDIESSFGIFLNRMIDKMSPNTIIKLSKWVKDANILEYLSRLASDLREVDDFEGQIIATDFLDKLPESVKNEILSRKSKEHNEIKKRKDMNANLELELVPQDANLSTSKKTRKPNPLSQSHLNAKASRFSTIDPFRNALDFLKFYRSVIKNQNPEAKFYALDTETSDAQTVLDLLTKNNRSGDRKFLRMWILNFFSISLRGNNIYNADKTNLKAFMDTFYTFNNSYYG